MQTNCGQTNNTPVNTPADYTLINYSLTPSTAPTDYVHQRLSAELTNYTPDTHWIPTRWSKCVVETKLAFWRKCVVEIKTKPTRWRKCVVEINPARRSKRLVETKPTH